MDKKGVIQEHSKIKLELYRLYLEGYLVVLINSERFECVFVHDIFAGSGMSENGEKGSALLAAIEVDKIRSQNQNTPIILRLNEKDPDSFSNLKTALTPFSGFSEIFNQDANDYIRNWKTPARCHNLFFIDPHGYTQLGGDNIKRLYAMERCDYLIFVPIYHIYRFLRKQENDQQLAPIATFLADLNIGEKEAASVTSVDEFAKLVLSALKNISGAELVYREMIKNRAHNSQYCLFFITRNYRGAEKFLEAQAKLKRKIKENEAQTEFAFIADLDRDSILNFIDYDSPYDNVALYERSIRSGILPAELNKELDKLEKSGNIQVADFPDASKRRRGHFFYVKNEYKKKNDRRVIVTFRR